MPADPMKSKKSLSVIDYRTYPPTIRDIKFMGLNNVVFQRRKEERYQLQ